MTVREASEEEIPQIRDIFANGGIMEESSGGEVPGADADRESLLKAIDGVVSDGGKIFVADEGGEKLGCILYGFSGKDLFTGERFGFIYDLYVEPSHRREGVARKLVEFCIDDFKSQGCEKVRLNVFAKNAGARKLYERLGFTEHSMIMNLDIQKP